MISCPLKAGIRIDERPRIEGDLLCLPTMGGRAAEIKLAQIVASRF